MELRRSYEGPEVVPQPHPQGLPLETVQYPSYAQQHSQAPSPYGYPSPPPQYGRGHEKGYVALEPNTTRRGLDTKNHRKWWIIGIVLLLVVAATVGGGVGGTIGSKKKVENVRYARHAFCSHVVS